MNLDDLRASSAAVLTVTQAAAILSDLDGKTPDERTVRRACEDGQLPCIRVGKRLLIPREAFLALFPATPDIGEGPPPSGPTTTTEPAEGAFPHGATNISRAS